LAVLHRTTIVMCLAALGACAQQPGRAAHEPVVEELRTLLDTRPDLHDALTRAIDAADVTGIEDLDGQGQQIGYSGPRVTNPAAGTTSP
jgi:hypothetical protein